MNNPQDIQAAPAIGTPDHYRETLKQILAANGWRPGSQAAKRAEYAFLQGIQAAVGITPFTYIPLISGRSILD